MTVSVWAHAGQVRYVWRKGLPCLQAGLQQDGLLTLYFWALPDPNNMANLWEPLRLTQRK